MVTALRRGKNSLDLAQRGCLFFVISMPRLPNKFFWSYSCLYYLQYCRRDVNENGQVNVAFSRTDNSIDVTVKSVQSLNDEEQVKGDDEDDCITPQDMMSFSWQIAQGMVSEKRFILFNCSVRVISCSMCLNAGKFSINYSKNQRLSFLAQNSPRVSRDLTVRIRFFFAGITHA